MPDPALDKFGKFVITNLRDNAIDHYDSLADGKQAAPALKKLRADLLQLSAEQRDIVRRCVISALDTGLHDLLFGLVEADDFEQGIALTVDGKNVVHLSDGLNGEQFSDAGWIARFGKHPELTEPVAAPDARRDEHAWRDEREDTAACPECGKPLRTAKATQCFQCGANWR